MSLLDKIEGAIEGAEKAITGEAAAVKRDLFAEFDALVERVKALEVRLGLQHDAEGKPL